jgi:hypothetical protein
MGRYMGYYKTVEPESNHERGNDTYIGVFVYVMVSSGI